MTTPSFLQQYNAACKADKLMKDIPGNPTIQFIWRLDTQIRLEFDEVIKQYQSGVIHSMELLNALVDITTRER